MVVEVFVRGVEWILPVVAGMVQDDIEEHAHVSLMGRVDQVDKILLGAEARVDIHVVLNRIAVIVAGGGRRGAVVFKNRRQPDRRTAKPLDVIEMIGDAPYLPATELAQLTRRATAAGAGRASRSGA